MNAGLVRYRVNGALLQKCRGKDVVLVGTAHDVQSNGMSFYIKATDDKDIKIIMNEPINDYVGGLAEVHGKSEDGSTIRCETYIVHSDEAAASFEAKQYNRAIELAFSVRDHYITGIPTDLPQQQ